MARVALLSNPLSTGNRSLLPRVRAYCADDPDIFHYEVEDVDQIGEALRTIARVRPRVLVVNGGDGTVQTTLTELYHGGHFEVPPPVAVLPNGKTNLIALDLGAVGDPLAALRRIVEIAGGDDLDDHVVAREMIALSDGGDDTRPVLGMFLGGAGLADSMLYCRHKIYPLGLPNGVAHAITALAMVASMLFGISAAFLPPRGQPVRVSVLRQGVLVGTFALLIVTTLHKLLLGWRGDASGTARGALKLLMVERNPFVLVGATIASLFGRLKPGSMRGVHLGQGDEIRIEGERSSVFLDGELFEALDGRPIVLTPTAPVPFLSLAAA